MTWEAGGMAWQTTWQGQSHGMADDASRSAAWHGEIDSVVEEESKREERSKQVGMGGGIDRYVLRKKKSLIKYQEIFLAFLII